MGWQLYKQKNGGYAIWSSIVDDFIYINCNEEFIKKCYANNFQISDREINIIIEKANSGIKHYLAPEFPQECLNWIKIRHGKKRMKKVKKLLEEDL